MKKRPSNQLKNSLIHTNYYLALTFSVNRVQPIKNIVKILLMISVQIDQLQFEFIQWTEMNIYQRPKRGGFFTPRPASVL